MPRFRLLTLFVAIAVVALLLVLNTKPRPAMLGHVSSNEPPIAPGIIVMGDEYGWPWTCRTESFKTEEIRIELFDRIYWKGLSGNLVVGLAIVFAAMGTVEACLATWAGFSRKTKTQADAGSV